MDPFIQFNGAVNGCISILKRTLIADDKSSLISKSEVWI